MSAISAEDICKDLARGSRICLINELDLQDLNMDDFYVDTFFISDTNAERMTVYEITNNDIDLKAELYKFCIENPTEVARGTKKYEFSDIFKPYKYE